MDRVDALVTAGGRGSRMRDVEGEKPLLPLLGRPMIDWVLDGIRSSSRVGRVCVSVSGNTPRTRNYLVDRGVEVIETSGTGYVQDLNHAMRHLRAEHVLVSPADLPLLTGPAIDNVVASYLRAGVGSYSVAVPVEVLRSLAIPPTFIMDVEGREVVLCGVSVVNRLEMLTVDFLSQGYLVTEDLQFALNVNTRDEWKKAEEVLRERTSAP